MTSVLRDIWSAIEAEVLRRTLVRTYVLTRTDIVGHRVVRLPSVEVRVYADGHEER